MKQIIFDTDPGVDDAIAIAFSLKAELPISAICTTYGNSSVENSTTNALMLLELMNSHVPVYTGSVAPIKGAGKRASSHGDNGLGGFTISTQKKAEKISALELYKNILTKAPEKTVTIIAIGPLTNLGLLALESPELLQKADQIIIMGGVFSQKGNITPYAEFNVYNDPVALEYVLQAGCKRITFVSANVCRKVTFTAEMFTQITNKKIGTGLSEISQLFIEYYTKDSVYGQFEGGVMYDLLALVYAMDDSLFTLEKARVTVCTTQNEKYGETTLQPGEPNCSVITDVDVTGLKKLYLEVMNKK